MNALTTSAPIIRFAPGLWNIYDGSIRRRQPEQYACLAGRYDDPFSVTDFRPMPPMTTADGSPNAGIAHVQINKPFIDHWINQELKPAGKGMIGAIHSHPGDFNRLSGSVGGTYGDIPAMRATLERAQKMGIPWKFFLAPILTFSADYTIDNVTGWIITLDNRDPIPATIFFEEGEQQAMAASPPANVTPLDRLKSKLDMYQRPINEVLGKAIPPIEDQEFAADAIRRLRAAEIAEFFETEIEA